MTVQKTTKSIKPALAALCSVLALSVSATLPASAAPSDCALASGDPTALFKQLTEVDKLPEVHRDASYIALQDKETWAMWTFTREGMPAHPAVVCRRPVKNGEQITLEMVFGCKGEEKACAQLEQDFKELNARMQLDIENQQSGKQ